MALGYFLSLLPGSPWWWVKSRSGAQVVEQAIHVFGTARYLLGEVEQAANRSAETGKPVRLR